METPTPHTPPEDIDLDAEEAAEQAAEVEDFDAWRDQQRQKRDGGRRVKIFGKIVTLPTSLPLGLSISMDTLSNSSDLKDVQHVVGELYGKGALDHWIKSGVDFEEFEVLMAWGVSAAGGRRITFDEAAALVAEARTKKASRGKGQGRKKPKRKR